MAEKQKPVAVCTQCSEYSFNATQINQRCYRQIDRKRCRGVFGSTIGVNDWEECPGCHAEGYVNGTKCDRCSGVGWFFTRLQ
jgi:hypothetical protein